MTVIDKTALFLVRAARNIGQYDEEQRKEALDSLNPKQRALLEPSVRMIAAMKEARENNDRRKGK